MNLYVNINIIIITYQKKKGEVKCVKMQNMIWDIKRNKTHLLSVLK